MADCIAVTLVSEFLSEVLNPYLAILEECQELVIFVEKSAGEIQSEEKKFTVGSLVNSSVGIVGSSLTIAAIGTATAPLTFGATFPLAVMGGIVAGASTIAGLVHSIVKALKKWRKHKHVLEVLRQSEITEKIANLFIKLLELHGFSVCEEARFSSYNMKKSEVAGTIVKSGFKFCGASNNVKTVVEGAVAINAVRQGKGLMDVLEVAPSVIKSSAKVWSPTKPVASAAAKISFLRKGWNFMGSAPVGYAMGAAGIAFSIGMIVYDALKLIKDVKCDRTKDLLAIVDMLRTSLQIITDTVLCATDEVQTILVSHLSCPDYSACSPLHLDESIYFFTQAVEELRLAKGVFSQ